MIKFTPYQSRPIRFLEIYEHLDWKIKMYSISIHNEFVSQNNIEQVKSKIPDWLEKSNQYNFTTYNIATVIIHEGREGCFAIINWWIDENMIQNFVYLKNNTQDDFFLYSNNEIVTCVWEMAIWWHERNAWIKHILLKNKQPDFEAYLNEQLNQD